MKKIDKKSKVLTADGLKKQQKKRMWAAIISAALCVIFAISGVVCGSFAAKNATCETNLFVTLSVSLEQKVANGQGMSAAGILSLAALSSYALAAVCLLFAVAYGILSVKAARQAVTRLGCAAGGSSAAEVEKETVRVEEALQDSIEIDMNPEEAAVKLYEESPGKKLTMINEVMLIHTDEVIL